MFERSVWKLDEKRRQTGEKKKKKKTLSSTEQLIADRKVTIRLVLERKNKV